jgi:hypothetical protein
MMSCAERCQGKHPEEFTTENRKYVFTVCQNCAAILSVVQTNQLFRVFWFNDVEVKMNELTDKQWESLERVWDRHNLTDTLKIQRGFGGDYIMIQVNDGLTLGIEKDGHTHS